MIKDYSKKYNDISKAKKVLGTRIPAIMKGYANLHTVSIADGVLSSKTKELIALGIAITTHCDSCIAYNVRESLGAGASTEEILETIGVAVMMGGGPSVIYGCEAMEALDQFIVLEKNGERI
jgi:AhpD family alkylhydroperoxidase